jgi:hypothetical protein
VQLNPPCSQPAEQRWVVTHDCGYLYFTSLLDTIYKLRLLKSIHMSWDLEVMCEWVADLRATQWPFHWRTVQLNPPCSQPAEQRWVCLSICVNRVLCRCV